MKWATPLGLESEFATNPGRRPGLGSECAFSALGMVLYDDDYFPPGEESASLNNDLPESPRANGAVTLQPRATPWVSPTFQVPSPEGAALSGNPPRPIHKHDTADPTRSKSDQLHPSVWRHSSWNVGFGPRSRRESKRHGRAETVPLSRNGRAVRLVIAGSPSRIS